MPIDQELLDILRCPETRQTLTVAEPELVEELNRQIGDGSLTNRGGGPVDEPIDGALIREDRKYCYPIRDEIPEMLIDHAIPLPEKS